MWFFKVTWSKLLKIHSRDSQLIGLCRNIRISCVIVDFTFPLTRFIHCISKRVINFHPSISIKANGITSHYSKQPQTVTSSYKINMRHGRKTKKLTLFDQIISRFKLKALYSVKYYNLLLPVSLVIIIIIIIINFLGQWFLNKALDTHWNYFIEGIVFPFSK